MANTVSAQSTQFGLITTCIWYRHGIHDDEIDLNLASLQ
jgi:hypothetical protein